MLVTPITSLPLTLVLFDGRVIRTFGEAVAFVAALPEDKRSQQHWITASRMLHECLDNPDFLHAAAMSLRSALELEFLS